MNVVHSFILVARYLQSSGRSSADILVAIYSSPVPLELFSLAIYSGGFHVGTLEGPHNLCWLSCPLSLLLVLHGIDLVTPESFKFPVVVRALLLLTYVE